MKIENVAITSLKPHPRNYRTHGEEQLKHIVESIRTHGIYRPIVIAKDGTILAGHGVVQGCLAMKMTEVPVRRLDIESHDPRALKLLAGDNEISRLGEVDDRVLTELLKDVKDLGDLLGTGFDDLQLANLAFVTRPENELADFNAAREWVGLPSYNEGGDLDGDEVQLVVKFDNASDRAKFVEEIKLKIRDTRGNRSWSTVWPYKERNDLKSVKFEGSDASA